MPFFGLRFCPVPPETLELSALKKKNGRCVAPFGFFVFVRTKRRLRARERERERERGLKNKRR